MPGKKLDQLSKQILLKGFVPVILIIFGIVALQYYFFASNQLHNNRINLSVIAKNLSTKIEGGNQFSVGLAQTMAQAQTNGLFGNRLGSSQYAKDVLTSHPTLTGAYFGYEPNADQSDQLFLSNPKSQSISQGLSQSGRFLPYWFRDVMQQNTINLAPLIDMEISQYYQGVKSQYNKNKSSHYLVTEPYKYEGKLIVEQVYPIVIDGEFKGVAGVDRALTDLDDLLKSESLNYAVDIFLISDQGRFISSTINQNTDLLTLSIDQTPYFELFKSPVLNRTTDWFDKAIDPYEQKEYFYASSNVETGNWLVIVRKSKDQVIGVIWQTAASLLGLSLMGLVISGWLIYKVLLRTDKRITLALNAANELAKGEIPHEERLYKTTNNDEISILLSSFRDVVEHYENIKLACEKMADGDFSIHLTEKSPNDVLSQSLNALAEKLNSTEKSMLEAMHQAESANQSKSQFLANMSHEIRTPMNSVLGLSRLCLNTQLNEQQKDYLENIYSSGRSLLNIINDILDFSKIESGKLELEKTSFSLESIFEDLSSIAKPSAHQKGLELLFNVPYGPVTFKGDPLRLGQILTNLTSNAIKFTQSGEVVINVKIANTDGTHSIVTFEIIDQGIGISPAQQQKLFSAFTQAENSTTRNYGGTGLGLVICKNLVELMGGQIQISSEIGIGTKVSFSIEFELAENKQIAAQRVLPDAMKDMRILVVDDSETARHIMQQQFQRLSLTCDVVKSGDEAIQKLAKHAQNTPYQLVLMDWKMPDMDGIETVRQIRLNPDIPKDTTILMVTAHYSEEGNRLFKKVGLNHFLKKPVSDSDLYKSILNCFSDNHAKTIDVDEKWQLANSTKLQGAHVLIVEDNLVNQQIAAEFLEHAGVIFDIVTNGEAAIKYVQKYQYHAVLMDLQMPIMGGIEATQIIRTLPEGKVLPIIAMTANAMEQHKQACKEAGMNAHLAKPIDADELYATLEQFIQHKAVTTKQINQQPDLNQSFNQPAPPTELSQDIAEFSYVDLNLAMSLSNNEQSKVIRLMEIFKNSHKGELPLLEHAMLTNSHSEIAGIAHSIAGVAEYVGCINLGRLARDYENFDGETGSQSHLEHLQSFCAELTGVMQDLDKILEAHKSENTELSSSDKTDTKRQPIEASAPLPLFGQTFNPINEKEQLQQILIVDDNPTNIAILQDLFQDLYQLSTAENGQQALDMVARNMPDLILLDIQMPVMDGYTTCNKLKQNLKYADIPIIFISGEDNIDEAKCLTLGAVDFISIPFVKAVIKARVATHMSLKQKTDLLQAKGLTDELTQVASRRAYKERISDELARAKRDKTSISLLRIDLDQFKLYNDHYGYSAGDQCLQKVASFLSLNLKRPADFISRISGEEFIVILPNTPYNGANEIAERLKNSIESLAIEHAISKHAIVTVSIGVTTAEFANLKNCATVTSDELMIQTDIGLYKAKKAGANQVKGDIFVQI